MRCLTLLALLASPCLAQQATPWAQTAGRATLKVTGPKAAKSVVPLAKFDPNLPQIVIEFRTIVSIGPSDLDQGESGASWCGRRRWRSTS